MSLSTLRPPSPIPLLLEACHISCNHSLPFWDCVARIYARCLHRRYPSAPNGLILTAVLIAITVGWYIRDAPSAYITPGAHIIRPYAPDLAAHAIVLRHVVHDANIAIFYCALTHITCGPSTIHINPQFLLLKVPHKSPDGASGCDTSHCSCSIRVQGVDDQILDATRYLLTGEEGYLWPSAEALLPIINHALSSLRPPSQFVCSFSEIPGTRIIGVSATPQDGLPPPPLPTIVENPECSFPPGELECACPPTAIGASEIIDDDFFEVAGDEDMMTAEDVSLWEFVHPPNTQPH